MVGADQQCSHTVLHIFSGDLWAGAEKVIATLLGALRTHSDLKLIALALNEGTLSQTLRASGIRTIVIPEANRAFVGIFREAMRSLKHEKIELIHSHGYKQNLLGVLLGRLMGVGCLVSTIHGLPEPSSRQMQRMRVQGFKEKLDYFLLKHAFTQVVAVSRDIQQSLIKDRGYDPKRVRLIYNGIDFPCQADHQVREDGLTHIGTVGRMVPVKDFELFLAVASEIHKHIGTVRFSILGAGPLRDSLASKINEMGLATVVHLEEPRVDPSSYYASLDVYMNTSLHEGLPLSILEAMSFGKPVVAPNVGGIPEIISHGTEGYLVDSRLPADFAGWGLRLIRDHEMREQMGCRASEKIRAEFSSASMAQAYWSLYLSLGNASSNSIVG